MDMKVPFDIKDVELEEKYEEDGMVQLYFNVPKDWLLNPDGDAAHATVSVDYPKSNPEPAYADVMISPTRVDSEGNGEDYDWEPLEIGYFEIGALIDLAQCKEEN